MESKLARRFDLRERKSLRAVKRIGHRLAQLPPQEFRRMSLVTRGDGLTAAPRRPFRSSHLFARVDAGCQLSVGNR
jgi:hypothetical protein